MRFAWWGAEESGLVGSTNYVNGLSQAEKDRIALYLNFDMIGSPNYIQMVYDSDQSGFVAPVPVPPGSIAIEDLFESFYTLSGEPYDDAEFSGRSDYQAFIHNGIPAGGLFTGAEVPQDRRAAGDLGRHHGRAVRPVLPRGLRHVRQQQPARARDQLRRGRVRGAHVRVLDRDGERRAGHEGARQVHHPGARRSRRHGRQRRRRRSTSHDGALVAAPRVTRGGPVAGRPSGSAWDRSPSRSTAAG